MGLLQNSEGFPGASAQRRDKPVKVLGTLRGPEYCTQAEGRVLCYRYHNCKNSNNNNKNQNIKHLALPCLLRPLVRQCFFYLPTFLFPVSPSGRRKLAKYFGKCSLQEVSSSHKMHSRVQRSGKGK